MGFSEEIIDHYAGRGVYDRIIGALSSSGIAREDITSAHLKLVDEFHIGGSDATKALLDPLALKPGARVLDIGSGIGGPARFMAEHYGVSVIGIDLTPDFVEAASKLTKDLAISAEFVVGSALDLPFADGAFDLATLLHVGMNLPDKERLFAEAARVLKGGGTFAVYDVMQFGDHPEFPLPWASGPEGSFLASPEDYLSAAEKAGFSLHHRRDRGDMAKDFFAEMQAKLSKGGAPAVGTPLLMGASAPQKIANMVKAVNAGQIAPVEMVFRKDAA